jgi:ATP-dependent DNA helicase DinG
MSDDSPGELVPTSLYPLLAEDGAVARIIEGFEPREQQQVMAAAVTEAMRSRSTLLCEAGTGTGKTLAYLVPALLSGKRVVISTGTRNLQDQLFEKDLPMVRDALGQPVVVVLLKGRANYLCLQRLGGAEIDSRLDTILTAQLVKVRRWANTTLTGDMTELTGMAEDGPVPRLVTSTADNCLGAECPMFGDCYLVKARRAALGADVVVVNHHLFFADMALREEGFGELLPDAACVIFDEAHQLPEVATRFFGSSTSTGQIRELADDSERLIAMAGGDVQGVAVAARTLRETTTVLRARLAGSGDRVNWEVERTRPDVREPVVRLIDALSALAGAVDMDDGGGELSNCLKRAAALANRVKLLLGECPENEVRWVELHPRSFTWQAAPLEVAEAFASHMRAHPIAWIFTSATLAVGQSFEHFANRMGISDATELVLASPFDYYTQALCYLPADMPEPREPHHTTALLEAIEPVLKATGGRAFLLFTSHRALKAAAQALRDKIPFPLLVQGEQPKAELVRRFVELGNAVLLGTASFWEGVDVRGDALSCVVIDKLPFAAPDDPVLEARLRNARETGGNPFQDFQVPQAATALKQGAGRLIRSRLDRGVLVLGDPRIATKGYGRQFVRALPPMRRTRELDQVLEFFADSVPNASPDDASPDS